MVEKEMASTSEAIEDAVRRIEVRQSCRMGHSGALGGRLSITPPPSSPQHGIQPFLLCFQQEMMSQARNESSGVKLEVNER